MNAKQWFGRWIAAVLAVAALAPAVRADDVADLQAAYARASRAQAEGKNAEAAAEYEGAVRLASKVLGPDHKGTAALLNNLANVYEAMGQYDKAEPVYLRALAIKEARLGKGHPDTASTLTNLANLYKNTGRFAEAEPLHRRSLAVREAAAGKDHPDVAASLNDLAGLYNDMGRYDEAEPPYRRALAIREAKLGPDHPDTAETLDHLAALLGDMGRYAEAEPLYRRALAIKEAKLGKDHPDTAHTLNNLAMYHARRGQYARAEPLYRRALAIYEERLGKDHVYAAQTINNLANLYENVGRYAEAEPLFRRSLATNEAAHGKDHPGTALALNNLAILCEITGRYAEAERLYRRALAIREAKLGPDHPETAGTVNNLAILLKLTGQLAEAEPLYRRALKANEVRLGRDHPDTAASLNNLAAFCSDTGRYAEAEPLFRRSLAIKEAALGKDHPDAAHTLHGMATLYARTAEWERSAEYRDRARRAVRTFVAETLPALSEKERERFLQTQDRVQYHVALSQGLLRRDRPAECGLSAGWALNGKAVAGQARAETALLARDDRDPQVGRTARELEQVRRGLAALALRPAKGGEEAARARRLDELSAQERELALRLSRAAGRSVKPAWVELADVRKAIPPGAVLIEIARFDRKDLTGLPGGKYPLGERYAAWVVAPAGEVRVVDLGDAAAIDAAVAAARTELTPAAKTVAARGEQEAEKRLRRPLQELAKLVLHPLLPYIGDSKTWVVSPDGNLWLAPWAALPLPDGSYAIEGHAVRFVVCGRDLVPDPYKKDRPTGVPLVVADPDFDADAGAAATPSGRDEPSEGTRGPTLGRVRRLPGTAVEAEALLPHLAALSDQKPRVVTEAEAVASVVRDAKSPKVLVLSTHGFFLENRKAATKDEDDRGPTTDDRKPTGPVGENPLLRCGLLFAGCNNAAQAKAGGDTGVLTGLEIVGTDLRGTELVVLSACETGLGDVKNGEGVAGLRQAFQLAGAESVVATLWQVPDRDSALLMASFFDKLAGKRPRDEALAEAQREMIGKRRARFGAAHPYFWAAYTLTGNR